MIMRRKNTTSRLRHKMSLQEEIRTADGAGGFVRSWKTLTEIWAEIRTLSGRESFFADKLESAVSHKILVRYREGVAAGQRLVHESRVFNIRYVANLHSDNEVLELLVEEGVAG